MLVGENIGKLSNLDYLEDKTLENGPQITHGYWIFHKFEGENIGDWPLIHQIC